MGATPQYLAPRVSGIGCVNDIDDAVVAGGSGHGSGSTGESSAPCGHPAIAAGGPPPVVATTSGAVARSGFETPGDMYGLRVPGSGAHGSDRVENGGITVGGAGHAGSDRGTPTGPTNRPCPSVGVASHAGVNAPLV